MVLRGQLRGRVGRRQVYEGLVTLLRGLHPFRPRVFASLRPTLPRVVRLTALYPEAVMHSAIPGAKSVAARSIEAQQISLLGFFPLETYQLRTAVSN